LLLFSGFVLIRDIRVTRSPHNSLFLGIQNVLDEDPPFAAGSFENGYDESLATIKGRFWYVQVKKRF